LEETENWLYEDGECEAKQVYTDRLAALKVCPSLIHITIAHWTHWRPQCSAILKIANPDGKGKVNVDLYRTSS